jgi:diadenosine tetraphosphate (Ap4A) HIT family hydrolase
MSALDGEDEMDTFKLGCNGCLISQGADVSVNLRGGIIQLEGNWILNHYGGGEGFLGWLILQPRFHRMDLRELEPREAQSLGTNVQSVDRALRQYWNTYFKNDPIQRVYVVYFHESVFRDKEQAEPQEDWHMHFHLIARTKRMGKLLRTFDKAGSIRAWSIPSVLKERGHEFPPEYVKNDENMSRLVSHLRAALPFSRP